MPRDDVKIVAVRDEQPQSPRRLVDAVAYDLDAAQVKSAEPAQSLVVVARNEHNFSAMAYLAENGLHDTVMGPWPYRAAPNLPKVDDVADQIDCLRIMAAEKSKQRVRPARARFGPL